MILIVDNFDSFVHNLARYVRQLVSVPVAVVRNDLVNESFVQERDVQALILSPGPCGPKQAGNGLQLVNAFYRSVPMLGVCLGHQVIVEALGGRIVRSDLPRHGKPSQILHGDESRLFAGVPSPFQAGRYHSLTVDRDSVSVPLLVTAWTKGGTVMAVEHAEYPVFGVQFHPESILTEHGYQIVHNFLLAAGLASTLPQLAECSR